MRARPDLARPAPSDLTALAARSSTRASTARAIDALDAGALQVLEAAAIAATAVTPDALLGLLGSPDPELVTQSLELLWSRALLWRAPEGLVVSRTVWDVLGPHIAGLGPTATELGVRARTTAELADALAGATPAAAAILSRLTWGPPLAIYSGQHGSAEGVRWLLDHELVRSVSPEQIALPREVALVLREGRLHPASRLTAPTPEVTEYTAAEIDAAAGAAASETLTLLDDLLSTWSVEAPRVLRTGGLAVRDLAAVARSLDTSTAHAAFLLEVAAAAGLLADDGEVEPHWAPTGVYDEWQDRPPGTRWAALASAWFGMVRAPHLAGRRASAGESPANALGPDLTWPPMRSLRRSLLEILAETPLAAPTAASLADALVWRRPRRSPEDVNDIVEAVLHEAHWLGVAGRGALSSAGSALLGETDDADGLAETMSRHLPATVDAILLQADLTAIAPGPVEGSLASFLRSVADIESRGGATVHRFSERSLRRALDTGWSADQILTMLADSSRTPVPQPLEYLVRDVARRHGQVRVSSLRSCVRADDAAVLDEMEASRALGALQFRRLAPTVLSSPVAADLVLDMLRENGFAPVAESASGTMTIPPRTARRAGTRAIAPPTLVHSVDDEHADSLIASLRIAEAAADADRAQRHTRGPSIPANDPTTSLALLREAQAAGHAVWLGYSDSEGSVRRLLFYPERVEGSRVSGTADGLSRVLSIHRITGVVAG